jgi:hypothetical protein
MLYVYGWAIKLDLALRPLMFYFMLIWRHFTVEYIESSRQGESVTRPIPEREIELFSFKSLVYLRDYPQWASELKDTMEKINVPKILCDLGQPAASPPNPDTFSKSCARWQRLSSNNMTNSWKFLIYSSEESRNPKYDSRIRLWAPINWPSEGLSNDCTFQRFRSFLSIYFVFSAFLNYDISLHPEVCIYTYFVSTLSLLYLCIFLIIISFCLISNPTF